MSKGAKRYQKAEQVVIDPKEKFQKEAEGKLDQFIPTDSQKEALNVMRQNTLTFLSAPPGTGKSSLALWEFCHTYLRDRTKQIVIIKSATEAGGLDKIGFLPGNLDEKLSAHYVANRKILEDFLGKGKVECDLNKRIHFLPPNYLLGMNLDDSLILVEEAQQLPPMIMKLILERTGCRSSVVVVGDPRQLYTDSKESKLRNGLSDAISRFFNEDGSSKYDDIGIYKFTAQDVMRSEIVKKVIHAYEND